MTIGRLRNFVSPATEKTSVVKTQVQGYAITFTFAKKNPANATSTKIPSYIAFPRIRPMKRYQLRLWAATEKKHVRNILKGEKKADLRLHTHEG